MARFALAFGKEFFEFNLDSRHIIAILKPKRYSNLLSPDALIHKGLNSPVTGPSFTEVFHENRKTVIVIPDKTRRCGAELFLPILIERLHQCGINDNKIEIILANGSHPSHKSEEIRAMVGEEIYAQFNILEHNCFAQESLVYLGETKFGIPVSLNQKLTNAEQVIVAGTVVHHYFAGFGGGPKMINPGCAGYETILRNHALTIDATQGGLHPNCRAGILEGNPVQEDIQDSMKFFHVDFLLETILDENGNILDVFGGELVGAHRKACEIVDSLYRIPITEKADLVVASCGGYPKDINFIQTHKSIENGFGAIKEGGVMLVLAECKDGIGSQTFLDWFDHSDDDIFFDELIKNYKLNGTTALSLKSKTRKSKIVLVSKLSPELVEKMGMIPAQTLREGWLAAQSLLPENFRCFILPNGSLTLPFYLEN